MLVWQFAHELANRRHVRGPRIVKVLNRIVGPWRNYTAVWITGIGPMLVNFVEQLSQINRGRAFYATPEHLGEYVLVDFMRMKRLPWPGLLVKKGDALSKNVAAASIVAKVERDAAMRRYHRKHPEYGFATNVGYGTREHWDALIRFGPSPIHRRSFYGVEGFVEEDGVFRPHKARNFEDEEAWDIQPNEETV